MGRYVTILGHGVLQSVDAGVSVWVAEECVQRLAKWLLVVRRWCRRMQIRCHLLLAMILWFKLGCWAIACDEKSVE